MGFCGRCGQAREPQAAFCRSCHAARNVRQFGATGTLAPGWAIGSWFIPLANLALPFVVVNQTWKASRRGLPHPVGNFWTQARQSGLVVGWWLSFVVATMTFNVGAGFDPAQGASVDGADWSYFFYLVSALLWVAAGVLGALVVRGITLRQDERIDALWPRTPVPAPGYAPAGSVPAPLGFAPPPPARVGAPPPPPPDQARSA